MLTMVTWGRPLALLTGILVLATSCYVYNREEFTYKALVESSPPGAVVTKSVDGRRAEVGQTPVEVKTTVVLEESSVGFWAWVPEVAFAAFAGYCWVAFLQHDSTSDSWLPDLASAMYVTGGVMSTMSAVFYGLLVLLPLHLNAGETRTPQVLELTVEAEGYLPERRELDLSKEKAWFHFELRPLSEQD